MKQKTIAMNEIALGAAALCRLMPMHLCLSADGSVVSVGPTLAKVFGTRSVLGNAFFDLFEVRRPGGVVKMEDLNAHTG